jgi:hypothetical protein
MVNMLERLKQTPNRMRSSDQYCTWPDAFAHSTILLATLKIVLEDQEGCHSTLIGPEPARFVTFEHKVDILTNKFDLKISTLEGKASEKQLPTLTFSRKQ